MPAALLVFIAPPVPEVLRKRLERRGTDSGAEIDRRLEVARDELDARSEFRHVIVNDDLERAAAELEGLVRSELPEAVG